MAKLFFNNQGNEKLNLSGYSYDLEKRINLSQYWNCELKKEGCKGRVVGKKEGENVIYKEKKTHNHQPDPIRKHVLAVLSEVRERAINSSEKTTKIIKNVKRKLPVEVDLELPTRDALGQKIKRLRMEDYGAENYAGRHAPLPDHCLFLDGEIFLLGDSRKGDDRIRVFGSPWALKQLCNARAVLMDGTFRCAPRDYKQIYTLHAVINCNGN